MKYIATKAKVFNRGVAPDSFLDELVVWGKAASEELFAPNSNFDIFNKVRDELGPWESPLHRRAVILEVMRVLALFESGCNWNEGVDTSKGVGNTTENAESGAWQVSWDVRRLDPSLAHFLSEHVITNGKQFQDAMKVIHPFAMTFVALLLRIDVRDFQRIANGPVRKGDERKKTWPNRVKLWDEKESIYPWLSRAAVAELITFLA